jgi:hypothetical protein
MDKEKKPIIIETADIYLHFPYIIEEEADDLADFLEEEHIEYEGATDIFIDLQNQVKKQKEVIDRTINAIDLVIELIKQQPTEDDKWILSRLNAFKIILKEVSE